MRIEHVSSASCYNEMLTISDESNANHSQTQRIYIREKHNRNPTIELTLEI